MKHQHIVMKGSKHYIKRELTPSLKDIGVAIAELLAFASILFTSCALPFIIFTLAGG